MDDLEKHMLRELYRSVCDPENPERLENVVPALRERVSKREVKFNVAGAVATAGAGIAAAALSAWHRLKG